MQDHTHAIKHLFVFLFRFSVSFAVCAFIADFTILQSAVLAGIAVIAYGSYRMSTAVAEHVSPQFDPFWVEIMPKWAVICKEYDIYDVTKWDDLMNYCGVNPKRYTIVRNGFNFTMLNRNLFFSNDRQYFFGDLDFRIPIEELLVGEKEDILRGIFAPRLYIKRKMMGTDRNLPVIEFGLVTSESIKKCVHFGDNRDEIPIARLPELLFFNYMNPLPLSRADSDKILEETNALLKEFEWTERERDNPDDFYLEEPFEVNHKMFRVTYRPLK